MIRTIIFDFGNVVGFFDHRIAANKLAEHCDTSGDTLWQAMFGNQLEDDYEAGRISTHEFLRLIRDRFAFRCSDEEVGTMFSEIFWPNPEIIELIPRLKPRYRLLLGSNTSELHAVQFRRQFVDVLVHFNAMVLSYEIGVRKPKPGFFERCVELAGCPASECVFIDDMPANVAGARVVGLHAIVYRQGGTLLDELRSLGIDI